jgi:hypothetical protein
MLCPEGVPSRPTPSATGWNLRKGTTACLGAGVRPSYEARSGFWEGERASEGRGCLERGTLNADRKANRKGAALFNGFLMTRVAKASSETRRGHPTDRRKNDRGKCSIDGHRSAHLRLFHRSPDVGASLGRAGIAGEIFVFKGISSGHRLCHWHKRRHGIRCRKL